jgi:hypothetical protein
MTKADSIHVVAIFLRLGQCCQQAKSATKRSFVGRAMSVRNLLWAYALEHVAPHDGLCRFRTRHSARGFGCLFGEDLRSGTPIALMERRRSILRRYLEPRK